MSKRIKIILTGSVLLNILLAGVIGGHCYKRWAHHPWNAIKQDMEPESRNHIARTFQGAFREIRPIGDEARKARADLVKIISAEEFDEKAFDEGVGKLIEARDRITALKIKATKDIAAELSAEERAKMAERMTDMIGGGKEKHVRRHRKPDQIKAEDVKPEEPAAPDSP